MKRKRDGIFAMDRVDGDEKISLDEDNSRYSYNQEGAGLNITNFPPEPISSGTHLRHIMLLMI